MTTMNSLGVAACLLLLLQTAASLSAEVKECMEENPITKEDVTNFFDKPGDDTPKDFKCYLKCLMLSYGVLKTDGSFGVPLGFTDKDDFMEVHAAGIECAKSQEKKDDFCEMAYDHAVCMRENKPEKWRAILLESVGDH